MICRKITIVARGTTEADVEDAFEEACDRLRNGYVEGTDRNETAAFYFKNEGNVPENEHPA